MLTEEVKSLCGGWLNCLFPEVAVDWHGWVTAGWMLRISSEPLRMSQSAGEAEKSRQEDRRSRIISPVWLKKKERRRSHGILKANRHEEESLLIFLNLCKPPGIVSKLALDK